MLKRGPKTPRKHTLRKEDLRLSIDLHFDGHLEITDGLCAR
jgi:hypothetical protein